MFQKVAGRSAPGQNAARMIQTNLEIRQVPAWQQALSQAFTKPSELLEFLGLPADMPCMPVNRQFPLRVPRGFAARMEKGNARDPLFLQVWPALAEGQDTAGFSDDAVGDRASLKDGGLIHKYEGRALVITTGACAVHCRYCFRQHFPYGEALASRDRWRATLKALADDRSIHEVILSGGDPLALTDDKLAEFAEAVEFLPHVDTLRIHTRLPVVLPERIDDRFMAWFARGRLRKVMVIHANHANEIDSPVAGALARLRDAGVTLLNQSVLLRGVNDRSSTLVELSERLFACGVMPYYLHMLDRVRGTAHFEVPENEARALMRAMSARLPGYRVPRLVREEPGAPSKIVLAG